MPRVPPIRANLIAQARRPIGLRAPRRHPGRGDIGESRSRGKGVTAIGSRGGPLARRPGERLLEAVVAPEHLAVLGEEGRGAEDAARARLLGQRLEPRLVGLALAPEDRLGVEPETVRIACTTPGSAIARPSPNSARYTALAKVAPQAWSAP